MIVLRFSLVRTCDDLINVTHHFKSIAVTLWCHAAVCATISSKLNRTANNSRLEFWRNIHNLPITANSDLCTNQWSKLQNRHHGLNEILHNVLSNRRIVNRCNANNCNANSRIESSSSDIRQIVYSNVPACAEARASR